MTRFQLTEQIRLKKTYLCVGLDTELEKIPKHLLSGEDPQFEFNRQIIDATLEHCVAYKINTAFYEANGVKGWQSLQKTVDYIPSTHFTIADAKRGDIGNTSAQYAKAFFDTLNFDSVTVAPYMGGDSVKPFLEYNNKWTILLGLTSNSGAADFEMLAAGEGYLYEEVMKKAATWGNPDNLMFVVGATRHEMIKQIRSTYPDHFFLVPGVGTQGGSLRDITRSGKNTAVGLLVNVSRGIIFCADNERFALEAGVAARSYQNEMSSLLAEIG